MNGPMQSWRRWIREAVRCDSMLQKLEVSSWQQASQILLSQLHVYASAGGQMIHMKKRLPATSMGGFDVESRLCRIGH